MNKFFEFYFVLTWIRAPDVSLYKECAVMALLMQQRLKMRLVPHKGHSFILLISLDANLFTTTMALRSYCPAPSHAASKSHV